MRAGKLFIISALKDFFLKKKQARHLRFLTILVSQYLSDADQEFLVTLLRVGTYGIKTINYLFFFSMMLEMDTHTQNRNKSLGMIMSKKWFKISKNTHKTHRASSLAGFLTISTRLRIFTTAPRNLGTKNYNFFRKKRSKFINARHLQGLFLSL
jgi:hypothetical protein